MNLSVSDVNAIKTLVSNDPTLCENLRESSNREELTNKLVTAALENGIVVDQAALGRGLDLAFDQYAENPELSDEQLENVTGGLVLTIGGLVAILAVVGVVGAGAGIGGAIAGKLINKAHGGK